MDDDYDFVDNVFCTAILQILKMPGVLSEDLPIVDLDEVKFDFERNGDRDETFHESFYFYDGTIKRKPLTNLQSKMNKTLSKKAQKLAKQQKK